MTPVEVIEYSTADGFSPFAAWFERLDPVTRARVSTVLKRIARGNPGNHLVVLLGGGTKDRQSADIEMALDRWRDFKCRH